MMTSNSMRTNALFWRMVPIAFLGFFIAPAVFFPTDLMLRVTGMGLLGFGICYLGCFKLEQKLIPIAGLMLLVVPIAPYNQGVSVFLTFAAFEAGYRLPHRWAVGVILCCIVVAVGLNHYYELNVFSFALPGSLVPLSTGAMGMLEKHRQLLLRQSQLSDETIEELGSIAERERIARDMHDVLGHSLSAMALKAELGERRANLDDNERLAGEFQQLSQLARQCLTQVRETIAGYQSCGIEAEVSALSKQLTEQGIDVKVKAQRLGMSPLQENTLTLVLREAMTNILRHSQASRVSINLLEKAEEYWLQIRDNGRNATINPGNGVQGMQYRLASLGGRLRLKTGRYTELIAVLPKEG